MCILVYRLRVFWLGFFDSLSGMLLVVFILAAGWLLVEFIGNFVELFEFWPATRDICSLSGILVVVFTLAAGWLLDSCL